MRRAGGDDDDADAIEAEGPGAADADLLDDDRAEEDVIDCPACGASIWREAERCPACRAWLTGADRERPGAARRAVWVAVVVVLVLVIVLLWR